MQTLRLFFLPMLLALLSLSACRLLKGTQEKKGVQVEVVDLPDALVESSSTDSFVRKTYNPAYTRINDLLHTKLDVRFDWEKQYLYGKAWLRLKPLFFDTDSLRLDAKNFDIEQLSLWTASGAKKLDYVYDDKENIYIQLDRKYSRHEEYTIYIEYTAKPNERKSKGSAAITDDKGLYFINPLGEDFHKPKQIWTQGETESSSCWFPTIDRPNERCTQELSITVEDKYKTLSNGLLKQSTENQDGTRTDYWVMDKPHAPYLFMMAVGEFARVEDDWEGMLLEYYVEPEYEAHAKAIFPHTPEMLSFFSEKLGVRYPWQKYSQVVTRDYVSGAMENTTAVIFGDFVQKTTRELIDNSDLNEGIVAHELIHHWFGDLVTCESWANLPLNESFANYGEYLWFEHKYGRDAADHVRYNEIEGYMIQALVRKQKYPLIRFDYKDKEDMFDSHSYNKGGAILHSLREYLGDSAFFLSLKHYLEKMSYKAAEVHDLRLSFEEVTGQDLNWFFNQWFFTKGHPKLQIKRSYDEQKKELLVELEQTQPLEESTVFILPFYIEIYTDYDKEPLRQFVWMKEKKQSYRFGVEQKPLWIAVDADRSILCERREEQNLDEWLNQYRLANTYFDKAEALDNIYGLRKEKPGLVQQSLLRACSDPFWNLRLKAVNALFAKKEDKLFGQISENLQLLAVKDPRSAVRAAAFVKLAELEGKNEKVLRIAEFILEKEQSYKVLQSVLLSLAALDPETALKAAERMKNDEDDRILAAVATIFAETKSETYDIFFETVWKRMETSAVVNVLGQYFELLKGRNNKELMATKISFFTDIALDLKNRKWTRYAAAVCVKDLRKYFDENKQTEELELVNKKIEEMKAKENDPSLQRLYKSW